MLQKTKYSIAFLYHKPFWLVLFFLMVTFIAGAKSPVKIIVDSKGKGDYKTVQEALNSLPDSASEPRTIYIKKGTYNEKVFITKHNIILEGEDRDKTIITYDIA